MKSYLILKQFVDYAVSGILILILSPVLIITALLVKLESPGSAIFKQKRIGKDKVEFWIFKFRTMRTDTPKDLPTHLFNNPEQYITRIGRFLRKSSLDELPQLFNILKGEMSFIGPRPALWNQDDLIEARDSQKNKYLISANTVKPGITGWAQVNGRDELPIQIKADFDGYYAAHVSMFLDIRILLMTIHGVLTAKGIEEGAPEQANTSDTEQAITLDKERKSTSDKDESPGR